MIKGIGCDLCLISRMEQLLTNDAFLKRYFAAPEQDYILSRGLFAASSMAAGFAAKEAFVKALGRGFDGIPPQEVVVAHDSQGAPSLQLSGSAQEAAAQAGVIACHLSLSHEGGLAMAMVVLEGK